MDNSANKKVQVTKGSPSLRLREILMDSDGLLTLVKLNFLFLITSVPILPLTAGPAVTALLYCTNMLVKTGSVADVRKTYFNVFKGCFRKTVPAGIIIIVLNLLFTGGLVLYLILASENIIYIPFASISLLAIIFLWSVSVHMFPAFTENAENLSLKDMVSAAARTAVTKMKETIIAVVISLFIVAASILMLPKTLPLVMTVMFSLPGLAAGFAHTDREFISDII